MDELIHHCLKELAFDGDLGCNVSRLREFIQTFHADRSQFVDDSYHALIWSIIIRQPSVRVGIVPDGLETEVYVPLQPRASKRKKDEGEVLEDPRLTELEILPEARNSHLKDLLSLYGDKLHVAVDPETSFAAITGAHSRPAKLSPMVYASLQLITRTRAEGLSVLELGKKTQYDQKTCFYLVKQLLELDLIVKLRRGGNSQNFCVHKYFFERSPLWQQIRAEEEDEVLIPADHPDKDHDSQNDTPHDLNFDPIDSRHLSSMSLLRSRLVKLLKYSKNNLHIYHNIIMAVGFKKPTKTDRRFFITRLRELMAEGVIEKVSVPDSSSKASSGRILCLRLVSPDDGRAGSSQEAAVVEPDDAGDKEEEEADNIEEDSSYNSLSVNVTLHKQMLNLLEKAGTIGMTLNEMSTRLGSFDKRTLDLLLTRLVKYPPPPHLADFGIVQVMETSGRERRYRFFTVSAYLALVVQEGLEEHAGSQANVDMSHVGEFSSVDLSEFYSTLEELHHYEDNYKQAPAQKSKPPKEKKIKLRKPSQPKLSKKRGRPPKDRDVDAPAAKRARKGETAAEGQAVTEGRAVAEGQTDAEGQIDTDVNGTVRQRERGTDEEGAEVVAEIMAPAAAQIPRKRGRPPRMRPADTAQPDVTGQQGDGTNVTLIEAAQPPLPKKKRGRPPKNKPPVTEDNPGENHDASHHQDSIIINVQEGVPLHRKRGRPSKKKPKLMQEETEGTPPVGSISNAQQASGDAAFPELSPSVPEADVTQDMAHSSQVAPGGCISISQDLISHAAGDERMGNEISISELSTSTSKPLDVSAQEIEMDDRWLQLGASPAGVLSVAHNAVDLSEPAALENANNAINVDDGHHTPAEYRHPIEPGRYQVTLDGANLQTHEAKLNNDNGLATFMSDQTSGPLSIINRVDAQPNTGQGLLIGELSSMQPSLSTLSDGIQEREPHNMASELEHSPVDPGHSAQDNNADMSSSRPTTFSEANLDPSLISTDSAPANTAEPGVTRKGLGRRQREAVKIKPNISQSRRENELYRVIEEGGGVMNTTFKDFREAHMALLDRMIKAGEVTSGPVCTHIDRRTLDAALNNLESRGRIKTVTTLAVIATGVLRPARVAYLVDLDESVLNDFLQKLGSKSFAPSLQPPPSPVHLDAPMSYGGDKNSRRHALALRVLAEDKPIQNPKERWSRNPERADQLFQYPDEDVRGILLTEKQTMSQKYGFIMGRALRARQLHLATVAAFESRKPSPFIVSFDHRVIDISYYWNDLSLSNYCSIVSVMVEVDGLKELFHSEEGKSAPMKTLSPESHSALQVGRSRSRRKVLDVLEILASLKIVTPLRATSSSTPWIHCEPANNHYTAFDVASESPESWLPTAAPQFWCFNSVAPIYFWALSDTPPPFHVDLPVGTMAQCFTFWERMEEVCRNIDSVRTFTSFSESSSTGPYTCSQSVAITLRREMSWTSSYILTWHQGRFLRRFVDKTTGNTPLEDPDGGAAQLQRICEVVSAPTDVVQHFFVSARDKRRQELEIIRGRRHQKLVKRQAKASRLREANEAELRKEKEWESLLGSIHTLPLSRSFSGRIKQIRAQFFYDVSGKQVEDWREDIVEAVNHAEKSRTAQKLFPVAPGIVQVENPSILPPLPILPANPLEKSVEELVRGQGEPIPTKHKKSKHKKSQKVRANADGSSDEEEHDVDGDAVLKGRRRRTRFQWNQDYDELARDASAIIRARCKGVRLEWTALDQAFPAVPRNSVRQRITRLRSEPGVEAYLDRLQKSWSDVWMKYRGSSFLPDEDPRSSYDFNLVKHIEFLRKHVDKNALRVGFLQDQREGVALPCDLKSLHDRWDVSGTNQAESGYDSFWTLGNDENREKCLLREAVTVDLEPLVRHGSSDEDNSIAESALKMMLGTPNEVYDAEQASNLLKGVGEQAVAAATNSLLGLNVLSKVVRDINRDVPGRRLKISESNEAALNGPVPQDTYQDALQLEESYIQQQGLWCDWPLLSTDGDTAALVQWVSDHEVDMEFDTSHARAMRETLDWNSKKADDDDLETSIKIRLPLNCRFYSESTGEPLEEDSRTHSLVTMIDDSQHGLTLRDGAACCSKACEGVVDCSACLYSSLSSFLATLEPERHSFVLSFLQSLTEAGSAGLMKEHILDRVDCNLSKHDRFSLIHEMTTLDIPVVFWTGYRAPAIVSSHYADEWTVRIPASSAPYPSVSKFFPRRWLDIFGQHIPEIWHAALNAVIGMILLRPGISQSELHRKFKLVYDRQEIYELLRYLQSKGHLRNSMAPTLQTTSSAFVGTSGEDEEKKTFWFVDGDRHWYKLA